MKCAIFTQANATKGTKTFDPFFFSHSMSRCKSLKESGWTITVETNITQDIGHQVKCGSRSGGWGRQRP